LPFERVERLYACAAMTAVTPQTPANLDELRARLDAHRAAGLAWSDGSYEPGISSVAAAVFDATGAPVAALNVSGQTANFGAAERREQIARAVLSASQEISQRLGWRPAQSHRVAPSMELVS